MELITFLIWLLMAFTLPVILLVVSISKYSRQGEISQAVFRFFISIVIYVPVTFFSLVFFGGLLNAVIHKHIPTTWEIFFCFLVLIVYAVIGLLLASFINNELIKPWLIFTRDYNSPLTVFDSSEE